MGGIWTFSKFIIILIILNGCAKSKNNPLEGTWRMESCKYTDTKLDQKTRTDASGRFCIKIMSSEHFAVVEMFKQKPDSLFFAAVGTYKLTRDKYIEKYEASNVGYQVGTSREFNYTLEGNQWTIYRAQEGIALNEVWTRMQ